MTDRSQADVIRWLRSVKTDQWYLTQNPISRKPLAAVANIGIDTLEDAFRGVHFGRFRGGKTTLVPGITQRTVDRLSPVIDAIEDGRLVFYEPERRLTFEPLWLDQPKLPPPPQASLIYMSDWRYWAPCRSCGGRKWMPIASGGERYAACYRCSPPAGYRAIGAEILPVRLVDNEIRAYLGQSWATYSEPGVVLTAAAPASSPVATRTRRVPNASASASNGARVGDILSRQIRARLTGLSGK